MNPRPIYETAETLEVERATLAAFLAPSRGLRAFKLPRSYVVDWAIVDERGVVVAWVECKRRYCDRFTYPTLLLSLAKWLKGCDLQDREGAPFCLVVEWDDGIRYVLADEVRDQVSTRIGGRTDRGDLEDVEPCVFLPVRLFHARATRQPLTEERLA